MQPNATPPAPPPVSPAPQGGSNPYYFMQDPATPPPKKGMLPSGNSTMMRLGIFLGGLVVLVIVAIVVMNLLNNVGKENTVNLITAAQQQTELMRVADIGLEKAHDNNTQNLAVITKLSLQTDQPALMKAIGASGTKVTPATLSLGKNTKTDDTLKQATQDNKFDDVFNQTLIDQLGAYQATLRKAYKEAMGKKLKAELKTDYDHITLILNNQTP